MRFLIPRHLDGPDSLALILVRAVVGVAFVMHGSLKIQHPFSWMGPTEPLVPGLLQAIAAVLEFGGGILLILGLFTLFGSLGIVAEMIAAMALVHFPAGQPFVSRAGGPSFELPLVYLVVALLIAFMGPGRWSLDAILFHAPDQPREEPDEEIEGEPVEPAGSTRTA